MHKQSFFRNQRGITSFLIIIFLTLFVLILLVLHIFQLLEKESNIFPPDDTHVFKTPTPLTFDQIQEIALKPMKISPSANELEQWKTYENKGYGFSFKYPPHWYLQENSEKNEIVRWNDPSSGISIIFEARKTYIPCALPEYLKKEVWVIDNKSFELESCGFNLYHYFFKPSVNTVDPSIKRIDIFFKSGLDLENKTFMEIFKSLKY